jgi:DNA-binding XRE family transcriptional regulator
MMRKPPLDFSIVERVRKEMLLTISDMAQLFGVTRMTYYSWLKGKSVNRTNDEYVRVMLKRLLAVHTEHEWPNAEVRAMDSRKRKEYLDKLLEAYQ